MIDYLVTYVAIGAMICAAARFFGGPPERLVYYPVLLVLWPVILVYIFASSERR